MKSSLLAWTIAISMVGASTAAAGQHGRGGGAGPKPTQGHSAQAPKPASTPHGHATGKPSGAGGSKPATHGASGTTHGASGTTHGGGHDTTATGSGTKSGKSPKTSTTTTSTGTLTPVQQKLQTNTALASKLQTRLPAGTDLTTAAAGFKNLGQFVAAVNVSNNLGLSFTDLKFRMVDQNMSLGQAIQDLRPNTNETVIRTAETDADALIRSTEQTTTKTKAKKTGKHGGQ
jgi:hypothetical protein